MVERREGESNQNIYLFILPPTPLKAVASTVTNKHSESVYHQVHVSALRLIQSAILE